MTLTPEDVVNKRFESTKFREGYDQDDVDDFLDEIVVELRRLNQENEELRQRLTAAESRSHEQSSVSNAPPPASAAAAIESAPAPAVPAVSAPEPASSALDDTNSTNNLLQLARRLHEEHVREGVAKRDALIAEGQASAAGLVADAESEQRAQLGSLKQEREAIEARIDSLRSFEREYREKLKSYIEGQLHELDSANLVSAGAQPETSQPETPQPQTPASQQPAPLAQPAGGHMPSQGFAAPQPAQQPPASFTGFSSN
ncbi:DivIVA domain-containing protein [Rhodoglobus vestalii]|uniref:Cell wall synthesis protein Wag31 n=1 Tax=Rhodoglobus vestalii TaxID=193384 RepID=A0A8H2K4D0_9MICO|nr:DivIVA domain-containing protein [Rhodoglobus vestalii]TQO18734.1 DivIVA domain-containing protein [Rhodoglobus vestalii]